MKASRRLLDRLPVQEQEQDRLSGIDFESRYNRMSCPGCIFPLGQEERWARS